MVRKADIYLPPSLQPLGLSLEQAAVYVGVSPKKFKAMVADGRMPSPTQIDARRIYDRRSVEMAYYKLLDDDDGPNEWDEVLQMARLRLAFVQEFTDRHGRTRRYFRRHGCKPVPLPGSPGSPEFMRAYESAMAGVSAPKTHIGQSRTRPGSISALVIAYYASPEFRGLAHLTQSTYRNIIERFGADYGDRSVAHLAREHVKAMMGRRAKTPSAANHFLGMLRILMRFAVDAGMRKDDPTLGIKKIRERSDGFHTWTEDEITAFETAWPIGTRARLAFGLLLYTAQRRSDVVRMGRQHVRAGNIEVQQQKTGTPLLIPLHHKLREIIAETPSEHMTFLRPNTASR